MSAVASSLPTLVPVASLSRRACGIVAAHATDAGTAERLSALGLGLGASFTVLKAGDRPVVGVGGSRIGLGPDLARALRAIVR